MPPSFCWSDSFCSSLSTLRAFSILPTIETRIYFRFSAPVLHGVRANTGNMRWHGEGLCQHLSSDAGYLFRVMVGFLMASGVYVHSRIQVCHVNKVTPAP